MFLTFNFLSNSLSFIRSFNFLFGAENVVEEEEEEEKGEFQRELVSMGALKWQGRSGWAEPPRYAQKAPKIVKTRVSPRTIQQPR